MREGSETKTQKRRDAKRTWLEEGEVIEKDKEKE